MKKKNGFTLTELLAVIVILAIIALIAVPQVIKILNKSRLSAAEDSTYGVVDAAEKYYANFMLSNKGNFPNEDLEFSCTTNGCDLTTTLIGYNLDDLNSLDYKGKKGINGTVTLTKDGIITVSNINFNGYIYNYPIDEKTKCISDEEAKDMLEIQNITFQRTSSSVKVIVNILGNATKYEYSIDGETYLEGIDNTYTFNNLTSNQNYIIYVKVSNDKKSSENNKNVTTLSIPVVEYEIEKETEWTQSKKVTITYPTGEYIKKYKILSGTVEGKEINQEYTTENEKEELILKSNGQIVAIVSDGSNEQAVTKDIEKIDSTVPTISSVSEGMNVILTLVDELNGSGISSYCISSTNDSSTCTFTNTIETEITKIMETAGTYYAFSKDTAGNISEFSSFITISLPKLENRMYISGEAITNYGGYNWHVIGDDGENVTLLMDGGQLENMFHIGNSQYSWDQSLIRTYLNGEFYNSFVEKIGNDIVSTEICINPSEASKTIYGYGGYTKSEIESLGVSCTKGYVNDNVRLISASEYYNLSPYYASIELPYTGKLGGYSTDASGMVSKIDYITRIDSSATDWLYYSDWWTMTAWYNSWSPDYNKCVANIEGGRYLCSGSNDYASQKKVIRPVITIQK